MNDKNGKKIKVGDLVTAIATSEHLRFPGLVIGQDDGYIIVTDPEEVEWYLGSWEIELGENSEDGSPMSDKEYVARKGQLCPVCKMSDSEGSSFDADGGEVYQEMLCNNCGASWTDIYKLTGYTSLEVP